ncbi:MAG TPA: DUF3014 domain-containing protein [Burkholderiales bacterium]|nr:DUF3014 domain-containing protein [Burkholderiales bacterium]
MEPLPARDDSPYPRDPEPPSVRWWPWLLAAVLVVGGAGYYFWQQREVPPRSPLATPKPPATAAEPGIRYPVDSAGGDPEKPLPALDDSDALMREIVTGLVDRRVFEALVQPTQLIRRVVATVDNLPRKNAPVRMMPVKPVPGPYTPGAANASRYAPYVRVLESLDARALVQRYAASYPLFQRAYAELGYPDRYFNDRLVEAIDDLLAAPDLTGPPELVQPKVFYEFASPDFEGRSAGQKIMMRMGGENAAKVKAKLREIRRELTSMKRESVNR